MKRSPVNLDAGHDQHEGATRSPTQAKAPCWPNAGLGGAVGKLCAVHRAALGAGCAAHVDVPPMPEPEPPDDAASWVMRQPGVKDAILELLTETTERLGVRSPGPEDFERITNDPLFPATFRRGGRCGDVCMIATRTRPGRSSAGVERLAAVKRLQVLFQRASSGIDQAGGDQLDELRAGVSSALARIAELDQHSPSARRRRRSMNSTLPSFNRRARTSNALRRALDC